MPVTKKTKRAMNLRGYQARQAAERAARLSSDTSHQSPALPTPLTHLASPTPLTPPTPPKPPTPPIQSLLPNPDTVSGASGELDVPLFSKHAPPPPEQVKKAILVLEARVNPKRKSGVGHQKSKLSPLALKDLSSVLELFRTYTTKDITWSQASIDTSQAKGYGQGHARSLRAWGRACLVDPAYIPRTSYGRSHDPSRKKNCLCDQVTHSTTGIN